MENKQSAEKFYDKLEEIAKENASVKQDLVIEKEENAKHKDSILKLQDDIKERDAKIAELTETIEKMTKTVENYQDLNQSLFLRVAKEVKQDPDTFEEEKDPLVASALKKIEEANKLVEEK